MGKNRQKNNNLSNQTNDEILTEKNIEPSNNQVNAADGQKQANKSAKKPIAALDTLWFALDYGNILSGYSLYKAVESLNCEPLLMNKPENLWSDHYAEVDNIAGKFIYKNCNVADVCHTPDDLAKIVDKSDVFVLGSNMVWSYDICGKQVDYHYYFDYVPQNKKKISYGSSFGYTYTGPFGEQMKSCARMLSSFNGLSVNQYIDAEFIHNRFGLNAEIVLDPVFICDKSYFEKCASEAPAKSVENDNTFIFTYIKRGNERKREFVMRGDDILTPNNYSPMRNFIDINRYPESKEMLGLDPAYHITVNDWLYYLINSEFVITDDYYGVCFALIFNKPFVFIESENYPGMNMVYTLLSSLGIEERIVKTEDDYKRKEYLFRMPIRYKNVNKVLDMMRNESYEWLKSMLDVQ